LSGQQGGGESGSFGDASGICMNLINKMSPLKKQSFIKGVFLSYGELRKRQKTR
jgi:hypothetical protein